MTDSEVAWLRSRHPFSSLEATKFPKATPLEGVLRNDCRIMRAVPGELIMRAGDYGGSAFFVLAGSVSVVLGHLDPAQLGRRETPKLSWSQAIARGWSRSRYREVRTADQVNADDRARPGVTDSHSAVFLQGFGTILADTRSMELGPGDMFGEIAAMYRTPHSATVVASTEATLVEIRWQGLRLLRRDARFAEQLEHHYRQHWLLPHLRQTPLLRHVPEDALTRVAGATSLRSFGRIEWNADFLRARKLSPSEQIASEPVVLEEGQWPTDLIIVRSGFARTSVAHGSSHRTTAYLGAGQLCGLTEVAHNALRPPQLAPLAMQHSLRAVGFLDTLHIPVEVFAADILPHVRRSELPLAVREFLDLPPSRQGERRQGRREKTAAADASLSVLRSEPEIDAQTGHRIDHTGRMEFVVQHRLFNGEQAMVIDLHRCTRCDDCVTACAATHDGNPRFVRDGVAHGRLQFVQACMHCTDPVCMIGCPTGAIHRNEASGVIQIEESICVGCGVCASACPYENIRMVAINDPAGRPYRDGASGLPILKATKCDLCQQQPAGPACVAACPHDALVRIDLTEPGPLQQWLAQR